MTDRSRAPRHAGHLRLAAIIGMLLAASVLSCGSDDGDTAPAIRLAVNPWSGSRVDAAVAAVLLNEELGFRVDVVEVDEFSQWATIAEGDLHACLEVWPSGHRADIETYIEQQGRIVDAGPLGPIGKIGWYVPSYLIDEYPELNTWEGLRDPDRVALFRTPASGSHGRFLAGDPTWVQYDAEIIGNLGLDFAVEFSGSESALLAELGRAYDAREPILFYFWQPHAAHRLYELTEVRLPPYSAACYATEPTGGIDCDYPQDVLFKILWPGLAASAPNAHTFLERFNYSTADQTELIAMVELDGKTPEQAARAWIAEHRDVWQAWIP